MKACSVSIALLALLTGPIQAQRRPSGRPPVQHERFVVMLGVAVQPHSDTFAHETKFPYHLEQARLSGSYDVGHGIVPDLAISARVSHRFAAAVAVTRAARRTSSEIRGSYPHPFFFNAPRETAATIDELDRTELGTHVSAIVRLGSRTARPIAVFAGPSIFSADQDLVTNATVHETYPYDVIAFDRTTPSTRHLTAVGFHVGADITWYLSGRVGVGGLLRYSRAKKSELTLGGLQAGGGLRLRF
jgi:hypothetical protein